MFFLKPLLSRLNNVVNRICERSIQIELLHILKDGGISCGFISPPGLSTCQMKEKKRRRRRGGAKRK